ncbi:uncharacterized protein LOC130713992 [Lotus japonicus]|uniref:uncharacterized protein LOC130713992 n=1 Tax=Lotus japonicus TaxID=34305 RepID=UPI002585F80F|nr:uncharacterized protein LOC130713992 [Lotus japonicus]
MLSSTHISNPTNSNSNAQNAKLEVYRAARMRRTANLKSKRTPNTTGSQIDKTNTARPNESESVVNHSGNPNYNKRKRGHLQDSTHTQTSIDSETIIITKKKPKNKVETDDNPNEGTSQQSVLNLAKQARCRRKTTLKTRRTSKKATVSG